MRRIWTRPGAPCRAPTPTCRMATREVGRCFRVWEGLGQMDLEDWQQEGVAAGQLVAPGTQVHGQVDRPQAVRRVAA